MCNQTVAQDIRVCKRVAESLINLRTEIALLCTKTSMMMRTASIEKPPRPELEHLFTIALHLTYEFQEHLDDANHFWHQIDLLAKRADA
jgi:hypothetical protein